MFAPRVADSLKRSVAVAGFLIFRLSACAADVDQAPTDGIVELYRNSASAVVRVIVANEDLDENGKPRTTRLAQSGFFVSREGRVLTNSVSRATRIWIEKDGLSYVAEVVGSDTRTNVGLLQVVKLPEQFGVISLSTLGETLPIGSPVLAVMSPLEFDPTPMPGVVAGYESSFSNFVFLVPYMRMNIPGPPGSSGSPVLDGRGRLAGIIVATLPDVNSSYAVTARALARIVEDLSISGRVTYGSLPIDLSDGADRQNISRQVIVSAVVPDSSAARAGIRPGDIVRRFGSGKVSRMDDVRDALFFARVGKYILIEIERDGRRLEFQLQIEPRAEPTASSATPPGAANSPGLNTTVTSPNPPAAKPPTDADVPATGTQASPPHKAGGG